MHRLIYPYREEIIRVGRCDCPTSQQSSGSIDGRLIVLPAIPGRRLQPKLRFRILELPIPEGPEERFWIAQYRTHFFRDSHYRQGVQRPHRVFLNICGDGWSGPVSVGADKERREFRYYGNKAWDLAVPMPPNEILYAITGTLFLLRGKGLRRWLTEMTPRGWVPPEAVSGMA